MKKFIILLIVALSACQTDFMIDGRLKPYVDSFYYEASLRGYKPQRDNLIIRIRKNLLKDKGCLGLTVSEYGPVSDDQITVLIDEDWFNNEPHLRVESVVFHELGHALLNRDHCNWKSIMVATDYYGYCSNDKKNCEVTDEIRDSFLDELFQNR